jgi:excisionase family DNA binding protein
MTALLERPMLPTPHEVRLAAEASRELSALRHAETDFKVQLEDGKALTLPCAAARLLHHLLTEMSQGNAVTLIPVHAELTTQEAADHLGVSRPYLIGILQSGKLQYRMVGTHRRIRFSDLEAYRRISEEARNKVMDELAAQAQELGMGY